MPSLIQILNANASKTPDEIATLIGDPFRLWRHCPSLTQSEYDAFGDTPIVLTHATNGDGDRINRGNVERRHLVNGINDREYPTWYFDDYSGTTLRNYWFRSLKSFEANPEEGFVR